MGKGLGEGVRIIYGVRGVCGVIRYLLVVNKVSCYILKQYWRAANKLVVTFFTLWSSANVVFQLEIIFLKCDLNPFMPAIPCNKCRLVLWYFWKYLENKEKNEKYWKEICILRSDEHFLLKYFFKDCFDKKLSPKSSGLLGSLQGWIC